MLLLLAPAGFAEVVFVLVLIVLVVRSIRERTRAARKDNKYHAGIGNALMQVEPIFRPSREHIIEARQYEEVEDDEDSDPPTTGSRH